MYECCCILIILASISSSLSSPSPDAYQLSYLDSLFSEDLLNLKESRKRSSNALLGDLFNTYVKADKVSSNFPGSTINDGYNNIEQDFINSADYHDLDDQKKVEPAAYTSPTKTIYHGSSAVTFQGPPTQPYFEASGYEPIPQPKAIGAPEYRKPFAVFASPAGISKQTKGFSSNILQPTHRESIKHQNTNVNPQRITPPFQAVSAPKASAVNFTPFTFFNTAANGDSAEAKQYTPKAISKNPVQIPNPKTFGATQNYQQVGVTPQNTFSVFSSAPLSPLKTPVYNKAQSAELKSSQPLQSRKLPRMHLNQAVEKQPLQYDISYENEVYDYNNEQDFTPQSVTYSKGQYDDYQYEYESQNPRQLSLFESINQPAAEREARRKQEGTSSKRRMSKSAALDQLMAIAGDNWEEKLLIGQEDDNSSSNSGYICPEAEGLFPSPFSCHEYFQCAQGEAHKQSCQTGLAWNSITNQCDWEESIGCNVPRP